MQPPDAKFPRPFMEITIRFGAPIDVARYSDRANDRLVLRQITDELMYSIRDLSGQDYVDTYATKSAETEATERVHIPTPQANSAALPPTIEPIPDIKVAEPQSESAQELVMAGGDSATAPRSSASVLQSRPLVDLMP